MNLTVQACRFNHRYPPAEATCAYARQTCSSASSPMPDSPCARVEIRQ